LGFDSLFGGSEIMKTALVTLTMCLLVLPAQAQYSGGSGTAAEPYQIATAEQMNQIGLHEGDWEKHFVLMADIDMSAYTGTQYNVIGYLIEYWHPDNRFFSGVFDGKGHTIRNFTYACEGESDVGLFGYVTGTVKNLKLVDVHVNAVMGGHVGALAGICNGGEILNCGVTGGQVSGDEAVGGLVGYNTDDDGVVNCYSSVAVTGRQYVGGLVGNSSGEVDRCYSFSTVTGETCIGGLVGRSGNDDARITDSYAGGLVSGDTQVGGLVGKASCDSDDCEGGDIWRCYSTARVEGIGEQVGGLVGANYAFIGQSYWDKEASGLSNMCGYSYSAFAAGCDDSKGRTTVQMKQQSSYWGWDFVKVWGIGEGQTYPYLRTALAGDVNKDGVVNSLDLSLLAEQWMEGEPVGRGLEITNVRIIRGELEGGVFEAIEEVQEVEYGDVFVIEVEVTNFGSEAEDMFNIYDWELYPKNEVSVIGDGFMACLAFFSLEPGESATLIPFCGNHAFEAKMPGFVRMTIDVGDGVCEGVFDLRIGY
jgi:hypothetical protein